MTGNPCHNAGYYPIAAFAEEVERMLHGCTGLNREDIFKSISRTVQSCLHRLLLDTQAFCRFSRIEALHISKDENGPIAQGQLG